MLLCCKKNLCQFFISRSDIFFFFCPVTPVCNKVFFLPQNTFRFYIKGCHLSHRADSIISTMSGWFNVKPYTRRPRSHPVNPLWPCALALTLRGARTTCTLPDPNSSQTSLHGWQTPPSSELSVCVWVSAREYRWWERSTLFYPAFKQS